MKTLSHLLTILVLAFGLLSGCASLYVPNTIHSPMLHEKGDFSINSGIVGAAPEPTFDFQGAYALSDHGAVMLNTSLMPNTDTYDSRNSHYFVESAYGLYTSFLEGGGGWNYIRAEIFGGYGLGWSLDRNHGGQRTGRYHRAFIKPAIGIRTDWFDLSFATRISTINFSDYREVDEFGTTLVDQLGFTTIEPVLTVGIGYENVRGYVQTGGLSVMYGYKNLERLNDYYADEGIFNIGLTYIPWREDGHNLPVLSFPPQGLNGPNQGVEDLPTELYVASRDVQICFQSSTTPSDGEVLRVLFDANFVTEKMEVTENPKCFDLTIKKRGHGSLRLLLRSEGEHRGNPVLLSVLSGGEEQWYYFIPKSEKREEFDLRVRE